MKKIYFLLPVITIAFLTIISCKKDDGDIVFVPIHDRAEEAVIAQQEIEAFLETHFYNYEEFVNPADDFDYIIDIDTISGDNSSKIPLMEQISSKTVRDRVDEDLTYTLYFLRTLWGQGESLSFPDICTVSYEGRKLSDNSLFDSSTTPVRFDLTKVVNGFQDGMIEFKAATEGPTVGDDGITTYLSKDFGVGAVFIPSGLGYFVDAPSSIGAYNQIYFTFRMYQAKTGDQDQDGVISTMEDLNNNGREEDDDTDGDGFSNFVDLDDDGDGTLTSEEVVVNEYEYDINDGDPVLAENEFETFREENINDEGITIVSLTTVTLTDTDSDGTPDYLDTDN